MTTKQYNKLLRKYGYEAVRKDALNHYKRTRGNYKAASARLLARQPAPVLAVTGLTNEGSNNAYHHR